MVWRKLVVDGNRGLLVLNVHEFGFKLEAI